MYWLTLYWPRTYLTVGVTAFILSALGMPLAIVVFRRLGIMDPVAANKLHSKPVVRGGGMIMFAAFAAAVLVPGYRSSEFNGVLIGAFICTFIGGLDDILGGRIPGVFKLVALVAATLVLERFGVRLNLFKIWPLDMLLTILWIVGVTSALNGIDNMDGLASGISTIASIMFLIIAAQAWWVTKTETSLSWFGMLAAGLIGANLGFLIFNSNPARIFMGDSGSFFLGYMLAALGVMGEWTENPYISSLVPILILGVPLFDFAYIIITRILHGETRTVVSVINHCAMDHLSHRLTWLGFSQRKAVLFIYLFCIALGATGILIRNSVNYADSILGLFQGLAIVAIVVVLMRSADRRRR